MDEYGRYSSLIPGGAPLLLMWRNRVSFPYSVGSTSGMRGPLYNFFFGLYRAIHSLLVFLISVGLPRSILYSYPTKSPGWTPKINKLHVFSNDHGFPMSHRHRAKDHVGPIDLPRLRATLRECHGSDFHERDNSGWVKVGGPFWWFVGARFKDSHKNDLWRFASHHLSAMLLSCFSVCLILSRSNPIDITIN